MRIEEAELVDAASVLFVMLSVGRKTRVQTHDDAGSEPGARAGRGETGRIEESAVKEAQKIAMVEEMLRGGRGKYMAESRIAFRERLAKG